MENSSTTAPVTPTAATSKVTLRKERNLNQTENESEHGSDIVASFASLSVVKPPRGAVKREHESPRNSKSPVVSDSEQKFSTSTIQSTPEASSPSQDSFSWHHGGLTPIPLQAQFLTPATTRVHPSKRVNRNVTPYAFPAVTDEAKDEFIRSSVSQSMSLHTSFDTLTPSSVSSQEIGKQPERYSVTVIAPPESVCHLTGDMHQESVARILSLVGACPDWKSDKLSTMDCMPHLGSLRRPPLVQKLQWIGTVDTISSKTSDCLSETSSTSIPPLNIADVLRVHEYEYVQHIATIAHRLESHQNSQAIEAINHKNSVHQPPIMRPESHARPSTDPLPMLHSFPVNTQPTLRHPLSQGIALPSLSESIDISTCQLDNDSVMSVGSWQAAISAAAAAVHAVDQVATGKASRVFVASRPPGHHAGPNGAVPPCNMHARPFNCSSGFCLFNNVAIAAAYARHTYGRDVPSKFASLRRIAIVDFDIHHGNGTEAIVRNLRPNRQALPLPSSWAPQYRDVYKPWLNESDADETLFASIHMHDGNSMYPGSGANEQNSQMSSPDIFGEYQDTHVAPQFRQNSSNDSTGGILNIPLAPVGPFATFERNKLRSSERKKYQKTARAAFREAVRNKLLPALHKFQPDIIFISAGFDGHTRDFYYHLTSADYSWITRKLAQVANKWASGRIISVLEGGYNVTLPPQEQGGDVWWDLAELYGMEHTLQNSKDHTHDSDGEVHSLSKPGATKKAFTKAKNTKNKVKSIRTRKTTQLDDNNTNQVTEPNITGGDAKIQSLDGMEQQTDAVLDHPDLQSDYLYGLGDSAFARSVSAHVTAMTSS